ncbi:ubiquitin carboxyl-terminal hydrolase 34-like [Porites lutea]|uniref:ubiquitin carboxyl-terminal hydrolase 34-like n=1 Tax=Porites lutea TaxID=51062 RepID=UPI003CC5D128
MLILYPNDFSEAIIPIIHGSHQHWNKTSPPGCLLAVEAISLHFTYFSKLWMEVYQKAGENTKYSSCIKQLCQQPEFLEYIELILLDERESLNVRDIYTFLCCFFPRVSKQVLVNQWTNLVKTLVTTVIADRPAAEKASDADLCVIAKRLTAELRAMSLLFSVRAPQKSDISPLLQPSLDALLSVCRRYQNKKQENAKATRAASETEQQQKNEESEDKKTGGEAEPVKKRRRTLEGEEQTSSKRASASSDVPTGRPHNLFV